ncbi:MAG: SAF domain-containing protein [Nocardioides sp.]|uniref:Flp pilus assembly protein CpaB n=1 Tax=Nocardioides sp. TaxID=35761 RepID=UPI00239E979E|nr:SAF domain-containing protein [Nocardioides sp.]MDE0775939.1 SAF domain-containing protein [Nocardioides sp.]
MISADPDLLDSSDGGRATARARLDRARWGVRRAVLRRRRLLAALLSAAAVWAGLSAASPEPEVTVPVLVAAHDLPAGVTIGPDDLETVAFRPGSEPSGAIGSVTDVAGRLLAAPLSTGEPVTAVRLVGADLARAHPGRRAVPVRLPDPGMVTLLEVGDLIDLIATDPEQGDVSTVAHAVPVLALPRDDEAGSGVTASGLPGRLVIVALAPAEVAPVTAAALRAFVTYTWSER